MGKGCVYFNQKHQHQANYKSKNTRHLNSLKFYLLHYLQQNRMYNNMVNIIHSRLVLLIVFSNMDFLATFFPYCIDGLTFVDKI